MTAFGGAFRGRRVALTGHTGFKGSWLSEWLLRLGAVVEGFSKDVPTEPSIFESAALAKRMGHTEGDVRDLEQVAAWLARTRPDFVFHLAAQPIVTRSYQEPHETHATNVLGTLNVLEGLRRAGAPCVAVFVTSDKCYENVEWEWGYRETDGLGGKDPYSASKAAAEAVIRSYACSFFASDRSPIRIASVRAGNVVGGGDWAVGRIVPDGIRAWTRNENLEIRSPRSTRPWQHVLEPLGGYLRCAQALADGRAGVAGEAFNFGPNADQVWTVEELVRGLSARWFGGAEEGDRHVLSRQAGVHEAGLLKLNCDKALARLGWRPVLRIEQAMDFIVDWYRRYYAAPHSPTEIARSTTEQIDRYTELAGQQRLPWCE